MDRGILGGTRADMFSNELLVRLSRATPPVESMLISSNRPMSVVAKYFGMRLHTSEAIGGDTFP